MVLDPSPKHYLSMALSFARLVMAIMCLLYPLSFLDILVWIQYISSYNMTCVFIGLFFSITVYLLPLTVTFLTCLFLYK